MRSSKKGLGHKIRERLMIFFIGAAGYALLEMLWRGYTHWTMLLLGGACFLIVYGINIRCKGKRMLYKCLLGSASITCAELAVGCIVNLWLGWQVWDYSRYYIQLWGQICLLYSFFWFVLCMPLVYFSGRLHVRINKAKIGKTIEAGSLTVESNGIVK